MMLAIVRKAPLAIAAAALFAAVVGCGEDARPQQAATPSPTVENHVPGTAKDGPLPTATATPTPPPTPTPTATPAPTGPSTRVDHGPRDSGQVALTFDMGGRVDPALDIMAFLLANEVRTTIFMTGAIAASPNTDAGRQVLGIIDEHPELFEIANHSYTHPDFTTLSDAEMVEELSSTEAAVAPYTSQSMRPLFRPPLGAVDERVLSVVGSAGYAATIMWDIDTIDWRPVEDGGPTAQDIVDKVLANAQGGTIVLMHLGGFNTLDALPAIVTELRERGFELVTVREMLGY